MKLNAIILAGGKSTRFGSEKTDIILGEKKIIELLISRLEPIFEGIIIVSNQQNGDEYPGVKVVRDVFCGIGPMGGIHAGLLSSDTDYNFVVACDMPFINPAFVRYMIEQIEASYEAIIPITNNYYEPLHGIYSRGCIGVIERMVNRDTHLRQEVKAKGLSLLLLLDEIRVKYIKEKTVRQFDSQLKMFFNINTTENFEQACKIYGWG